MMSAYLLVAVGIAEREYRAPPNESVDADGLGSDCACAEIAQQLRPMMKNKQPFRARRLARRKSFGIKAPALVDQRQARRL
jgi:hypothetical protein